MTKVRLLALALPAFLLSDCFDQVGGEGQPCNQNGQCQPGLVCNEDGICVKYGTGECDGKPAGEACGDSSSTECTLPDKCDGDGRCLSNHMPAGTPCGDQGVVCHKDDACDGAGNCFDRGYEPEGTQCPDNLFCNGVETCDGAGVCRPGPGDPCPPPTVCNEAQDTCTGCNSHTDCPVCMKCNFGTNDCENQLEGEDLKSECDPDDCREDFCDGKGACGARPDGTACGDDADTECDNPDSCDGLGNCSPRYEIPGTPCGDPNDSDCDNPDTCDGSGNCSANHEPSGKACSDGLFCNGLETCDGAGTCLPSTGDPCVPPTVCDEDQDACVGCIPDGAEVCDGFDNDCDGTTDGMTRGCNLVHYGICAVGTETCDQGIWTGCPLAGDELCDPPGEDEDCDGSVDEECECTDGQQRDCPVQMGVCAGAEETCVDYQWPGCDYAGYSPDYEVPPEQSCDGLDNDCNGDTDGMIRSCSVEHQGQCAVGTETCTMGIWEGCPLPQQEECNGVDDDCDGDLDAADGDLLLAECEYNTGVCAGNHRHDPSKCVDGQWQPCDHVEYGPEYGPEICADAKDNDCDGISDCGPAQCEGDTRVCYNDCLPGQETCQNGSWVGCDAPAKADETPLNDNCGDGLDNDCDSATDCAEPACDGFQIVCWKVCHPGHQHCENGVWTDCDAYEPRDEYFGCMCCNNGIDDDCDGRTDWDDPDC